MSNRLSLLVAAVQAVLAALVLVGIVSLSSDQIAGIVAAVNAVVFAVAAWFDPAVPVGKRG
jgi:hypothetical protein